MSTAKLNQAGKTNRMRHALITGSAILLLPLALFYTSYAINSQALPVMDQSPDPTPMVSVIAVKAQSHQARLQGHGEARPRYELTLTAEIAGRITALNPAFEAGQQLQADDWLLSIDATTVNHELASAEQNLAEADLALLEEQQSAKRALHEWQRAGINSQASPLLLRQPQLAAAKAQLQQAQAQLKQAQYNQAATKIRAPYAAMVIERIVAPGQYVQAGDSIATLYSIERIDVRISLPLQQWSLLPETEQLLGQKNVLLSNTSGDQWLGVVSHVEHHVDRANRQRSLVVSVDHPLQQPQPLLAGTFLSAEFSGKQRDQLLALPASSLAGSGDIWYVDQAQRLSHFPADIVFQQQGTLFIKAPTDYNLSNPLMAILTAPLSSYVSGQAVIPQYRQEVSAR